MYKSHFRDVLPTAVADEFDSFAAAVEAVFETEHDTTTGEHTDVRVDSLGSSDSSVVRMIDGQRWLSGPWFVDELDNNDHVAGIRPDDITANQNNYNPPGLSTALVVEVSSDADRSITGLTVTGRQKRLLIFGNRGNFNITLEHDHASSLGVNRFGLPGNLDVVLGSSEYILLYYDVGSEIWRAVSYLG